MVENNRSGRARKISNKATIFDVAQAAGVSIKTVSRVVNNEPSVRDKTRQKVQVAISELHYQPNSAARGLSSKRSYVIGLIYENADEFSYMKHVLDAALAVCEAHRYTLLLRPLTLPNQNILEQIRAFAVQARVDGVLLPAPMGDVPGVGELFGEMAIPFAMITPKVPATGGVNVFCDDDKASSKLTEHLIEQGHTRIAFVKGHPDHWASHERVKGYRAALKKHGIEYDSKLVCQGYFTFESGQHAATKLLALKPRPSAIMASSDDMAAGIGYEVREQGLDVPGDISIVGFDDTPVASHMWPPLTTVRQPIAGMAEAATTGLINRISGNDDKLTLEPFKCEVVIRRSTQAIG